MYIWKVNLSCKKSQKHTNIKVKYRIDGVNKLFFGYIDCRFGIVMGTDQQINKQRWVILFIIKN